MDRRAFIVGGAAVLAAPLAAEAQQAGKVYRIGYLQTSTREEQLHVIKAFEDGLRDLGYRVGQNAASPRHALRDGPSPPAGPG